MAKSDTCNDKALLFTRGSPAAHSVGVGEGRAHNSKRKRSNRKPLRCFLHTKQVVNSSILCHATNSPTSVKCKQKTAAQHCAYRRQCTRDDAADSTHFRKLCFASSSRNRTGKNASGVKALAAVFKHAPTDNSRDGLAQRSEQQQELIFRRRESVRIFEFRIFGHHHTRRVELPRRHCLRHLYVARNKKKKCSNGNGSVDSPL